MARMSTLTPSVKPGPNPDFQPESLIPLQVGRNISELEDLRLIVHRDELYLQFVGSMRGVSGVRGLEGRQWLARLERNPQVTTLLLSCCSEWHGVTGHTQVSPRRGSVHVSAVPLGCTAP